MNPDDNNLDGGYESSIYSASLESKPTVINSGAARAPYKKGPFYVSLFRYNRLAIIVTIVSVLLILFAGITGYVIDKSHQNNGVINGQVANGDYKVGGSLSVSQASPGQLLNIGQVNELQVNGQLKVSNSLVLTPSSTAPSSPTTGQIYYNKTSNQPYYYNGSQFVTFSPQSVTSLGGASGVIGLGSGLTMTGGNLAVSSSLYQLVNESLVNSIQGLKGQLTLNQGSGVSINGTTITNTGVISLASSDQSILITNEGNGVYNLNAVQGGPGSTAVQLDPVLSQIDSNNGASININKTGSSGNLVNLETNSAPVFVVGYDGSVTTAGTFLQSGSGSFTTGTGAINLNGNTTINGGNSLTVTTGNTSLGGTLSVSGASALGTLSVTSLVDTGTASVQGDATLSGNLTTLGNSTTGVAGDLDLASGGTNGTYVEIEPSIPTNNLSTVVSFPALTGGGTDQFCLTGTDNNCSEGPGGVTEPVSGTAGTIAEFGSASDTIQDSPISDNGSNLLTVNSAYTLNVSAISSSAGLTITPSGSFTLDDPAQIVALQGNTSSYISVSGNSRTTQLEFTTPTSGAPSTQTIKFPDPFAVGLTGGSATVCLANANDCGFATTGSGVTMLNGLIGSVNIQDALGNTFTASGNNIPIPDATTTNLGLLKVNGDGNLSVSSGVIDTAQSIQHTSDVQFNSLSLNTSYNCGGSSTGNICLTSSGTVFTNNISAGAGNTTFSILSGGEQFVFPTGLPSATYNICVSGGTCATGGGAAVLLQPTNEQTFGSGNPGLYIDGTNSSTNLVQLQTGPALTPQNALVIDGNGNATFSNTTTITNLSTNNITSTGTLSIGSTSQQYLLQGDTSSEFNITSGVNSNYYSLGGFFSPNSSGTPYYICTTVNTLCNSTGSVSATGATKNYIPEFTGTVGSGGALQSSILSQNGSTIEIGDSTAVAGQLTFGTGSAGGSINFVQPSSPPTSAINVSLPSTTGTLAVKGSGLISVDSTGTITCTTCASTGGPGGPTAVDSINTLQGDVDITDASNIVFGTNTSGGKNNVVIPSATNAHLGLVEINGDGNLSDASGVIDTAQAIQTSSSPQFASIQLGSNVAMGNDGALSFYDGIGDNFTQTINQVTLHSNRTITIPDNSGQLVVAVGPSTNLTLTNGVVDTANAVTFTTSVTTPQILSGSSTLKLGLGSSSAQAFNLNGAASTSLINLYAGSDLTEVNFAAPSSASNVITFPDTAGRSANVCVQNTLATWSNCTFASGLGGTGSTDEVAFFTGPSTLSTGTNNLFDNGTTVGVGGITSGFGTNAKFTVGTNAAADNTAEAQINSTAVGNQALVLQGVSGQTKDIFDVESNTAAVLLGVSSTGILLPGQVNTAGAGAALNLQGGVNVGSGTGGSVFINGGTGTSANGNVDLGTSSTAAVNIGGTLSTPAINVQGTSSVLNGTLNVAGLTTISSTGTSGVTPVCLNASNILSSCNVNAGGVTLQEAYDASVSPQLTLDNSPGAGALLVQDNTTPLAGNLFVVQSHGGGTKYLTVTDNAGTSINGGLTVSSGGETISSGGLTVTLGGAAITGNSTITGSLSGITGLTVASGGETITSGNLTVSSGNVAFQRAGDVASTGNINNLAVTGALVRFTGASAQTLTGITGGTDGRILTIVNAATSTVLTINNNDTADSSASNVVITGTGNPLVLSVGASISLVYDAGAGANVWRVEGGVAVAGGTGGANNALSNLITTSINMSLQANTTNTLNLGSSSDVWQNIYGTSVNASSLDTISAGTLSLGTSVANQINIGKAGVTTSNLGALTVTGVLTASNSITVSNTTGTGVSETGLTTGTGINLGGTGVTSGTGLQFSTAGDTGLTTGSAIAVNGSTTGALAGYTGNLINVSLSRTNTAGGTLTDGNTGSYLNVSRSNTENAAGGTYNVTGSLVNLQSNCTQTAGTCNDSSNILNLNQQYASATGAVLNITNSGTGNAINFAQNSTIGAGANTTSVTGYGITLQAGNDSDTTGNPNDTGGSVTIQGGNATTTTGTKTGGSVTINGGSGSSANGSVNIGQSTTASILFGGTGNSTGFTFQGTGAVTINSGALTVGTTSLPGIITLAGNTNNVLLEDGVSTAGYTIVLPTVAATASGQCLQTTSGTTSSVNNLAYGSCSSTHTKDIIVPAEYAGAVLDTSGDTGGSTNCNTNNIGTMISGYSGNTSPQQNYYNWSTTQTTAQCYDVVVQIPVPSDWSAWSGTPYVYGTDNDGSSNTSALSVAAYETSDPSSGSPVVTSIYGYTAATTNGTSTLAPVSLSALSGGTANGTPSFITLKFRLTANNSGSSNSSVSLGNIVIPYTSAY